jgi:hypothetical protein
VNIWAILLRLWCVFLGALWFFVFLSIFLLVAGFVSLFM